MIALGRQGAARGDGSPAVGWIAVVVALVLAGSPLATGYFNFSLWGPLSLGAMVLLIVVAWTTRPELTRRGAYAAAGLLSLLGLSAASILWAQSKDSAWTDTNRLALYAVLFAIVLLSVRDRRTARVILIVLGLAALLTSLWFPISFLLGGGGGAFLTRRLDSPIGYINGTAGLLAMGVWPWIACAERARSPELRAAALGAAAAIAGTFVLTQSRAVIPATVVSAALVLACAPGRTRRALKLIVIAASVAVTLHWTLAVYATGGIARRLQLPEQHLLREAGAAILIGGLIAAAASLGLSRLGARFAVVRRELALRRLGMAMLAVAVLALGAGAIAGHGWVSRQYRSFTALQVNESASTRFADASGFRYDLWRIAVREFREHPLGGLGAGNYDTEYYRLRRNPQYIVQPHSLELQMAAELGIGGLLALVVLCGAVLAAGFARARTLASGDLLIRLGALGMFGAWLADTSVDWLYDIPGLTGMALVAGALLLVPVGRGAARPGRERSGALALVLGLALLALLAASVGRQYAANRYADSGVGRLASAPRQAIATLRTAVRLDPYSLSALYALSSAYARLDDYTRARAALLVAEQREPGNYVPPALLGDLASRRGEKAVAIDAYRRALRLNPRDPEVRQSLRQATGPPPR